MNAIEKLIGMKDIILNINRNPLIKHADFYEVFSLNEAQTKDNGCASLIYMLVSQDLQFAYPLQDRRKQTLKCQNAHLESMINVYDIKPKTSFCICSAS